MKNHEIKNFDLQGIELNVPRGVALAFIADPAQLPKWTEAFASIIRGRAVAPAPAAAPGEATTPARAVMRTPGGEVTIDLEIAASPEQGTVDWRMTFPDGSTATAFSRVVELDRDRCAFSFILTPPPVPLEQLEGALEAQSRTLTKELKKLKDILERHG
jgi:hypothetical protein